MQTIDQVIDEILLKSSYGFKAYVSRHKRLRENRPVEIIDDEVVGHPKQTYFDFKEDKNASR